MPISLAPISDARRTQMRNALEKLRDNPRVWKIRVAAPGDCALAEQIQGVYAASDAPSLPVDGCSRSGGCICTYEPILSEIYP